MNPAAEIRLTQRARIAALTLRLQCAYAFIGFLLVVLAAEALR